MNTKISEFENKIPNSSSLVTAAILNKKVSEVENKIPDDSKYITTQESTKLTTGNFLARLKRTDLVNKTDFDNKLTGFNKRITSNKTKNLEVQKKLNKLSECRIGIKFDKVPLAIEQNNYLTKIANVYIVYDSDV